MERDESAMAQHASPTALWEERDGVKVLVVREVDNDAIPLRRHFTDEDWAILHAARERAGLRLGKHDTLPESDDANGR
jgi:hypothetical protein